MLSIRRISTLWHGWKTERWPRDQVLLSWGWEDTRANPEFFWGGVGVCGWYLRVAMLMRHARHAPKILQFENWNVISKTVTPEILAMPQSRNCNEVPFKSICLYFSHNIQFFLLLQKEGGWGLASHAIPPPINALIVKPWRVLIRWTDSFREHIQVQAWGLYDNREATEKFSYFFEKWLKLHGHKALTSSQFQLPKRDGIHKQSLPICYLLTCF